MIFINTVYYSVPVFHQHVHIYSTPHAQDVIPLRSERVSDQPTRLVPFSLMIYDINLAMPFSTISLTHFGGFRKTLRYTFLLWFATNLWVVMACLAWCNWLPILVQLYSLFTSSFTLFHLGMFSQYIYWCMNPISVVISSLNGCFFRFHSIFNFIAIFIELFSYALLNLLNGAQLCIFVGHVTSVSCRIFTARVQVLFADL